MGEGTLRDPLFDDSNDPSLDFNVWMDLSVARLKRDREARADILARAGISEVDWLEADDHWTRLLLDEVSAGKPQRAATYGARCAAELRRRDGASLPAPEPDEDLAPLPAAPPPELAKLTGIDLAAAQAPADPTPIQAALTSFALADTSPELAAVRLPDAQPPGDIAPPPLGAVAIVAAAEPLRQVVVPSYLKAGAPGAPRDPGAPRAPGAPPPPAPSYLAAPPSPPPHASPAPPHLAAPAIVKPPRAIHPGAVTTDALPIPRGAPLPFTQSPAGAEPSRMAQPTPPSPAAAPSSERHPHRALGATTALPEGMLKDALPLPFSARTATPTAAPATAPTTPNPPPGAQAPQPPHPVPAHQPLPAQPLPTLTLDQYAAMCAESSVSGASIEQALARYGLSSIDVWRAVDRTWQDQLSRDPALMQRWRHLTGRYREMFQNRRG